MGGNIARMGELRNAYIILIGKPEQKILLGAFRHIWVYIMMDLRVGSYELDSSGSEQVQVDGFCKHSNEPSVSL
jgi:hypothetical protein